MSPVALRVQDVSKEYRKARASVAAFVPRRGGSRSGVVHALRNVSFEVPEAEIVGVIGANGAGKSTLLRIITGVVPPSSGEVTAADPVTAILEISTGLIPDLTGRENIRVVAPLYGMTGEDLAECLDDIIQFASLGRFIDFPVRAYSSGMKARLAFSIVTAADPRILLIDETLSVGDAGFALRCRQRLRRMCRSGATVMLVSHDLDAIRELCDRVLWIRDGEIAGDGPPDQLVEIYREESHEHASRVLRETYGVNGSLAGRGSLNMEAIACLDGSRERQVFHVGDPLAIEATIEAADPSTVEAHLQLVRFDGVLVYECRLPGARLPQGRSIVRADLGTLFLGRFTYRARIVVDGPSGSRAEGAAVFAVEDHRHSYNSTVYVDPEWSVVA